MMRRGGHPSREGWWFVTRSRPVFFAAACMLVCFVLTPWLIGLLHYETSGGSLSSSSFFGGGDHCRHPAGWSSEEFREPPIELCRELFSNDLVPPSPRPPPSPMVLPSANASSAVALSQPPPAQPEKAEDEVVVLLWDNPWGMPFYWGDGPVVGKPNYAGFEIQKEKCAKPCRIVRDRALVTIADALLFDACYYGTDTEWMERPPFLPDRREGQPWGWYTYEQKNYFRLIGEPGWLDYMDFKATYHHDAEVQVTFVCPWGSKKYEDLRTPPPPKSDDKLVAFIASNCGAGGADGRLNFVRELMKHIRVDSFGLCLHNADIPEGKGWHTSFGNMMDLKMRVLGEYKFFLAFENNNEVDDYVTEKMMNALYAGTVPVYRGAPNIDMWVPGDHAIINVADFEDNPKLLADYLLMLARTPSEYERYFDWKKKPFRTNFDRLFKSCVFFADCRICDYVREARAASTERPLLKTSLPLGSVDSHALEFNRIDERLRLSEDFVQVQSAPSLNLEDSYTLMAWINLELIGDGRIIDKTTSGQVNGYLLGVIRCGNGQACLRFCAGGNCYNSVRKMQRGLWYHVAASFRAEADGVRLYINGKLDRVYSPVERTRINHLSLQIGYAHGASSWRPVGKPGVFDGVIDDPSIWGVVLSEAFIHRHMYTRFSGREEGLIAYWGFNEGEGVMVYDASPNKLHGRLHGQVRWVPAVTKPVMDISTIESI
jgi:hypothetical protein